MDNMNLDKFQKKIKNGLYSHSEILVLIILIALLIISFSAHKLGMFTFTIDNSSNVLGTLVQSLASIFAIIFSISLVAIQFYSESISYRLIGLYVKNRNFMFPFFMNFGALLFDLYLLSDVRFQYLIGYGIISSIFAILSLGIFFLFTIRILNPLKVISELLKKIKTEKILTCDFSENGTYEAYFQPIDDIVTCFVQKGDYATAYGAIDLINGKLYDLLIKILKKLKEEQNVQIVKLLNFMSKPFARLFEEIAISSNKKDAMEITSYIINIIGIFVRKMPDARFVPAFKIFDETIERISFQAECRFRTPEYIDELTNLKLTIASVRVEFSRFAG